MYNKYFDSKCDFLEIYFDVNIKRVLSSSIPKLDII